MSTCQQVLRPDAPAPLGYPDVDRSTQRPSSAAKHTQTPPLVSPYMSTAAGAPSNGSTSPDRPSKGKGKNPVASPDVSMEDDEGEEDEDEDEEMDEDDEEDDEDEDPEIDPSAIITGGRRTRGIKVDYTSEEALKKAGLKPEQDEDDEDDEVKHKGD